MDKIEGIISFPEPSDKRKKENRRWSLSGNVRFSIENNTWTCRDMEFLFSLSVKLDMSLVSPAKE